MRIRLGCEHAGECEGGGAVKMWLGVGVKVRGEGEVGDVSMGVDAREGAQGDVQHHAMQTASRNSICHAHCAFKRRIMVGGIRLQPCWPVV